jgi:ABC-type phosphate transport system substrate-binding protein
MIKAILTAIFLIFFATLAQAEIVVIGNVRNDLLLLNATQVEDIFMGRTRALPNGQTAQPVDQSALRPDFYQALTARPIEQINAYWAKITFTGQASPPMILNDDNAVINIINENKDAIGYIDKKHVDSRVRILLILN